MPSLRVGDDVWARGVGYGTAGVVWEATREGARELWVEGKVIPALRGTVRPVDGIEPFVERDISDIAL